MKFIAVIFLAAAFSSAVASADVVKEVFGGKENMAVVTGADRMEACILRHIPPPDGRVFGLGERYEETEFVAVSQESSEVFKRVLVAHSTYVFDVTVGCWPIFQTRMRFHRADAVVDLDFCFGCHIVSVSRNGKIVGGGLFLHDDALLAEMRKVFPKNPALAKAK